jgi:hypothetical protein
MARQRAIRCLTINFANTDIITANVFISFPVSCVKLKHISTDVSANTSTVTVAEIAPNMINTHGCQAMIGIPIPANSVYIVNVDIEYDPCATNISGQYTFNLRSTNGALVSGITTASASIMLTLEFLGMDQ